MAARRLLSVLWLVAVSSWATVSMSEEQRKVVILVQNPGDRALVERIRGQISDLPIQLEISEGRLAPEEEPPASPDTFAVVWFTRDDPATDRVLVHAATLYGNSKRTVEREVGNATMTGGELGSATLEAAALVVRAALRDLSVEESLPAATPSPTVVTPPKRPQSEPGSMPMGARVGTRAAAAAAAPAASPRFRAEARWEGVIDGAGGFRRFGPGLRLGGGYRASELAAFGALSLSDELRDAYGSIRLRRYAFGLRGAHEWSLRSNLTVDIGVLAGVALYARQAEGLSALVTAAASQTSPSSLLGAELRLAWAPGAGRLAVGLAAGLNWIPGAPRIGYEVNGRFEPSFVIWRLQPSLGIGAQLTFDAAR